MNKEGQITDENIATDTDTTGDPTVTAQEQGSTTQTALETHTATEPSAANSPSAKKSDGSLASAADAPTTTQPLTPESEPTASSLNVLTEINQRLQMLQEVFGTQNAHDNEPSLLQSEVAQMDQRLTDLHELFKKEIAHNQSQRQIFDTIYREMTSYKEDALLEAYHKPIIHNLIQLYDNLELVESQLSEIDNTIESQFEVGNKTLELLEPLIESASGRELKKILSKELSQDVGQFREHLKQGLSQYRTQFQSGVKDALLQFQKNLENVRFELEEVLYRMDVTRYEEHPEKLDSKLHKTLGTTPTDDPDKDREIVEIHKTGFYWHEKVFRPEEVTIYRYVSPTDKPEETAGENPADEKGDEIDG